MPIKTIASFEVLSQPVAPGIADVPYVEQGFFLQISNLGSQAADVQILYNATPAFVTASGAAKLFCNIINQTGLPTQYSIPVFLEAPVGFGATAIPAGATYLFGVQYILNPPPAPTTTPGTGGTPQDTAGTRGYVQLEAAAGTNLLVLATTRQVFNNYSATGALIDVAEGAYAVPLLTGPEVSF